MVAKHSHGAKRRERNTLSALVKAFTMEKATEWHREAKS